MVRLSISGHKRSITAVLSMNIVATNLLLSVFYLSGASAVCSVWSNLFLTAPPKMEALSGSCLQIPCSFSAPYKEKFDGSETFGVWIRGDPEIAIDQNNVIFNSSGTVNTHPMKITGNLKKKICTTLLFNLLPNLADTYFFRVEKWPFRETALCNPLQITVQDSPQRPRIEISGDLKEKESVTITCSAFTPCPHSPPQLTWTLQQDSHNYIQENTDGTFTTKIQETITLSDNHDGNNITCSAKYPVGEGKDVKTAEETKTLSVSYAPKNIQVSVSPSGLVSAGQQVNLTCSSRANPPVSHFIWFKISEDGDSILSEGEIYSFTVTDRGDYYCVAVSKFGIAKSSKIRLTVKDEDADVTDGGVETVTRNILGTQTLPAILLPRLNDTGGSEFVVYVTVKISGIVVLCSVILILECWLRSKCCNKPQKVEYKMRPRSSLSQEYED